MSKAVPLDRAGALTRATLGHAGRDLTAGAGTLAIYLCLIGAVLARLIAGFSPGFAGPLYLTSGLCWIFAFGGFGIMYGPMLLQSRVGG
jgi:uncharacterized protein involved in response to NO